MSYETVEVAIDGRGVATVTLNRPDKHNAMNAALMTDMRAALADLRGRQGVRAVVLTGAGESFCAGGDLNWMREQVTKTRQERITETRQLATMLAELNSLPMPLIGKINGPAYGGGIGMISV